MSLTVITYSGGCLPDFHRGWTWWPERDEHPDDYQERARGMIVDALQSDVTVVTLDVVFFAAIQVAIHEQALPVDAKLVYLAKDTEPKTVQIDNNGRMKYWPCFNVYHNLLLALLCASTAEKIKVDE